MKPIDKAVEILGGTSMAAEKLSVTYQAVKNWQEESRSMRLEVCIKTEIATQGSVTCEELIPDFAQTLGEWLDLRNKKSSASKKNTCEKCGGETRTEHAKCSFCRKNEAYAGKTFTKCALCGGSMPKVRARTSPYCSLDCSNKVGKIRGKVSAILNKQIRCGAVKPASSHVCVDCGAAACDYDHRDYLKPLDVVPVCRPCNQKRGPAVDLASAELKYLRGTKKAA